MNRRLSLLILLAVFPATLASQDLGFATGIFGRVHRLSLFVNALEPTRDAPFDPTGRGCITLKMCGAGVRVLIDLDTRTDIVNLELGLGAGYLRSLKGGVPDELDIRGALRSLPVISAQTTVLLGRWVHPYFVGSFGLVDIWNGRAHNALGKQAEVKATTFEYGLSGGISVMPPFTNGRMLLEAGYRARQFASVGYGFTEPLGPEWPRQLDFSGWQVSAGWQFDLRPIAKSPEFSGAWVLTKVDGNPIPITLRQVRGGTESVRDEIMSATLRVDRKGNAYALSLVMRHTTLSTNGAPQEIRFGTPLEERGTWSQDGRQRLSLTPTGAGAPQTVERLEDELILSHAATGRRFHFRKVRSD